MSGDVELRGPRSRAGIGFMATVVQRSELRFSRLVVDRPTLIVLSHGTKVLQSARGQWSVKGGEAIVIAGGQTFDVTNRLSERGHYEARWLVWDPEILDGFERTAPVGPVLTDAAALGKVDLEFAAAFDRACAAIGDARHVPDEVARHRLAEVLVWLALKGVRFSTAENPTLAVKVRRLFESDVGERWTILRVAKRLAVSEATLRRRLSAEGTTAGDLLTDVRMSQALLLLQSTDQAVNRIALEVGYESASRFAIRFRERFGFPPTAIRGHARTGEERLRRFEMSDGQAMAPSA